VNAAVQIILIFAATAAGLGLMFWALMKERNRVYGGIRGFKERAKAAKDRETLLAVRAELSEWTRQNCWHHEHVSAAMTVDAYIDGRLAGWPGKEQP
jgi:hypothetical protein